MTYEPQLAAISFNIRLRSLRSASPQVRPHLDQCDRPAWPIARTEAIDYSFVAGSLRGKAPSAVASATFCALLANGNRCMGTRIGNKPERRYRGEIHDSNLYWLWPEHDLQDTESAGSSGGDSSARGNPAES